MCDMLILTPYAAEGKPWELFGYTLHIVAGLPNLDGSRKAGLLPSSRQAQSPLPSKPLGGNELFTGCHAARVNQAETRLLKFPFKFISDIVFSYLIYIISLMIHDVQPLIFSFNFGESFPE